MFGEAIDELFIEIIFASKAVGQGTDPKRRVSCSEYWRMTVKVHSNLISQQRKTFLLWQ